uniref:Uncharacterized protein n=1 Tax=Arundo donax TaxID=35708 RepID=A0A0A8XQN4_ARUDO
MILILTREMGRGLTMYRHASDDNELVERRRGEGSQGGELLELAAAFGGPGGEVEDVGPKAQQ